MPFAIGPKIHSVIAPELRDLIEGFFSFSEWKGAVYLTGGTCLAEYYFGHRISYDMDLFSSDPQAFLEASRSLGDPHVFGQGAVVQMRKTPHLAQYLYTPTNRHEPVKIDLMLDVAVHITAPNKIGHVWIDSLDDLLSNKLGCLVQRNELKDYLDLYYLLPASHFTTKEAMEIGRKKEAGLDPLIVANQIEFLFHQKSPAAVLLGKTDWNDLQLFFKKFQKECLQLIAP